MNHERGVFRLAFAVAASVTLAAGPSCSRRAGKAGRIRILAPYLPESVDPCSDSRLVSRMLAVNVFDPLVRAGETGEPVPALAVSWSNPGPETWRIRLRPGARFSDGTPVTAGDVVRSFDRARAKGSTVAGNLAVVREVREEASDVVTITATPGANAFLLNLTAVLIAREVPARDGRPGMLGSGPYEVVRLDPGRRIEMRASPAWSGPPLRVADVVWEAFHGGPQTRRELEADPRTLVIDPPAEAVAYAKSDRRFAVSSEFSGALAYLAFGLTPADGGDPRPFADRRAREAVRLALDVPALLAEAGPAAGYPATQVVPSGVFGFDHELPLRSRDLMAARALLAEAGWSGRPVVLDATEPNASLARAIAAQLREAGLSIEVRILPSPQFRERIEGRSDLFLFSWVVGPEAGEALKDFFHSKDEARRLGLRNRTGWASAEFDAAIEEVMRVGEPSERLPLLQRAIRAIDQDVPWVPLFTIRSVRIHPADLKLRFRSDAMLLLSDLGPAR